MSLRLLRGINEMMQRAKQVSRQGIFAEGNLQTAVLLGVLVTGQVCSRP